MRTFIGLCFLVLSVFVATAIHAEQCQFTVSTPKPLLLAGKKQTTCVKVGIKGFEMKEEKERASLNIALVIDRSGSMSGQKMKQAKEAAIQALQRLDSRDIVSVITFDTTVDVVVPATKLTDLAGLERKIRAIEARGSTALYDGTKMGAAEVKKFFDKDRVNRVILLSDGQANVGPSTTAELAKLGGEIGESRITITTFGLGDGYNEDLMSKLASTSDGNHAFIEQADNLADIFQKELNTALAVVAQEVSCTVGLPKGIRPVRALNMDVDIKGQEITFGWNQIYSRHERFVLIEVEVPSMERGKSMELAKAELRYTNMETKSIDKLSARTEVKFVDSESEVNASIDKSVMEDYIVLIANIENERATRLRDEGKVREAEVLFRSNAAYLDSNATMLGGSDRLQKNAGQNKQDASNAASPAPGSWGSSRKGIVERQRSTAAQQSY